jgi:membrane protein YdbS with pleckstrin-like domain
LAGFVVFVGTLIVRHNELSFAANARVGAVSLVLVAAALLGPLRRWRRAALVVTPSHLEIRLPTWRERRTMIPLRDLHDVDVHKPALGRRLDFGTMTFIRGDDVVIVHHVRAPQALRDALRRPSGRR